MLTIDAFKLFCITVGTEREKQIHKYYIKLERTLQEVIKEECNDFKLQLEQQQKQMEKIVENQTCFFPFLVVKTYSLCRASKIL